MTELTPPPDVKKQFVTELREVYREWCSNIKTIPSLTCNTSSVDAIYTTGTIECLTRNAENIDEWESLETYKQIRSDHRVKSNRRIIESGPGYGKSLLTLQLAHEWSTDTPESCLKDVEILIVLQLREISGLTSIYKCIRQCNLKTQSIINVEDIQNILQQSSYVLFVLDSVDEYRNFDVTVHDDILAIIQNEMFPHFEVILTTRTPCIEQMIHKDTKRLRLTGFNNLCQDEYLRKIVTKDDDSAATRIKESLQENPTLGDLCRVPIFFAVYAHIAYKNDTLKLYTTMTGYFRQMIACFHNHFISKMDDQTLQTVLNYDDAPPRELKKFAYDCLLDSHEPSWSRDRLCQILGDDVLQRYLRIGIFCEVQTTCESTERDEPRKVIFNHGLFCEWYAALYMVDVLTAYDNGPEHSDEESLLEIIDDLYPYDFQNLYRFVCGIKPDVAKYIIQYIRDIDGVDQLAILCMLEQSGDNHNVYDTLKECCSETINIHQEDTMLWQKSVLQILSIASIHKVTVSNIMLHDVIQKVDVSGSLITMKSGLSIPIHDTLKHLWVRMAGSELNDQEMLNIFHYASNCENLCYISFADCIVPRRFQEYDPVLSKLCEKAVEVFWYPTLICYRLNLRSGYWEHPSNNTVVSPETMEKMVKICKGMNP
ncbi:uncharacterized protein [Apostichopus japonicus]|uniref:uncharacterized protein n=1 Tax=Stichopus japonicus TaxID=307972 RepID=UPI003AB8B9EE